MSHWGATVITNLLSAIPFIGQDIVPLTLFLPLYLIWGLKMCICLIISICSFIFILLYFISNYPLIQEKIKIYLSSREYSSNQKCDNTSSAQPGEYKGVTLTNKNKILLYKFIGFIDGDGYIRVTKKSKLNKDNKIINYIYISLVINLNEKEFDLLNIFNALPHPQPSVGDAEGSPLATPGNSKFNLGNVYYVTPKKGNKLVRLEINKTNIKNILIPLLDNNNIQFLTKTRQEQYLLVKYIFNNNLTNYEDIDKHKNNINNYIDNNIIKFNFNKLDYFKYWLVGFTMAEGSFVKKNNQDMCFQLKQKYNFELFNSIKTVFNINKGISINKDKYIQLCMSSKKDIQKVIDFFSEYQLLGYKLLQYNKWLLDLKSSNRYKYLNMPDFIVMKSNPKDIQDNIQ